MIREPMFPRIAPGLFSTTTWPPLFGDLDAAFKLPQRWPMAVLALKLDGVNTVTWAGEGSTGDEVLGIVLARLSQALAAEDVLTPLEGSTFACLLAGPAGRERLCHIAWKLLDAAAAPLTLGKFRVTLHPWIGIALCPADGATYAASFRNAHAAMHRARHQKSGYAFFDESADVWDHDD